MLPCVQASLGLGRSIEWPNSGSSSSSLYGQPFQGRARPERCGWIGTRRAGHRARYFVDVSKPKRPARSDEELLALSEHLLYEIEMVNRMATGIGMTSTDTQLPRESSARFESRRWR
jgi:hypothetical protein